MVVFYMSFHPNLFFTFFTNYLLQFYIYSSSEVFSNSPSQFFCFSSCSFEIKIKLFWLFLLPFIILLMFYTYIYILLMFHEVNYVNTNKIHVFHWSFHDFLPFHLKWIEPILLFFSFIEKTKYQDIVVLLISLFLPLSSECLLSLWLICTAQRNSVNLCE